VDYEAYLPAAAEILNEKPLPMGVFLDLFRGKTGLTVSRSKAFKAWATSESSRRLDTIEQRGRGAHEKLIGLPDAIYRVKMARGILE
jgi:hypothetical protein